MIKDLLTTIFIKPSLNKDSFKGQGIGLDSLTIKLISLMSGL